MIMIVNSAYGGQKRQGNILYLLCNFATNYWARIGVQIPQHLSTIHDIKGLKQCWRFICTWKKLCWWFEAFGKKETTTCLTKKMDSTDLDEDCFSRFKKDLFYCIGLKEKYFLHIEIWLESLYPSKLSSFALNSINFSCCVTKRESVY
jgi:hypothetical protein